MDNLTPAEWLKGTDEEILVDVSITHPSAEFPRLLEAARARFTAEHRIASSLGELRRAVGVTQVEMGQRWGCTQSFISKIERDPASVEMGSLIKYVRALRGQLLVTVLVDDHVFTEELVGAGEQQDEVRQ
jgi:DNA-binding XRE family transcriptional regulator